MAALHYDGGQVPLRPFDYLPTPSLSSPTAAQVASTLYKTPSSSSHAIHEHSFSAPSYQDIVVSHEIPQKAQCSEPSYEKSIAHSIPDFIMKKAGQLKVATLATVSSLLGICGVLEFSFQIRLLRLDVSAAAAERRWIGTSNSLADRQICKWIGICGLPHLTDKSSWAEQTYQESTRTPQELEEEARWKRKFWNSGRTRPEDWTEDERRLREIPQYILDYAPYVHLYSGEEFWPCDIADHLIHTTPHLNYTLLRGEFDTPNLTNLNELNEYGPRNVYLQSDDNVENRPEWLGGKSNIPALPDDENCEVMGTDSQCTQPASESRLELRGMNNIFEKRLHKGHKPESFCDQSRKKPCGGRSDAPAVLVAIDKGNGVVDAFWFFFYSYNLGNEVLNIRFGNHVGDWEHTLVRFKHGEPAEVFFSEHSFGEAYAYGAVEKIGKRVSSNNHFKLHSELTNH